MQGRSATTAVAVQLYDEMFTKYSQQFNRRVTLNMRLK